MVLDIILGINSATSIIIVTFPQHQFKGTSKRWFYFKGSYYFHQQRI